jgi:ABC-2 type transport system permease protein
MRELNAVLAIANRDFLKLLRDPTRFIFSLIFPLIFIAFLGGGLQASFGSLLEFDLLAFTFIGVLGQTVFQSSAMGVVSLIEDRTNDFSQEIFVSPVSRYSIVLGKILGESLVSMAQALPIMVGGLIIAALMGVQFTLQGVLLAIPALLVLCFFGGAFGVLILANLGSRRTANEVFPFLMLPQYFLAGIFTPIKDLPWFLSIPSHLAPMRYAVDFLRGVFYVGRPEYDLVVSYPIWLNLGVIAAVFAVLLVAGTFLFVRAESNR